MSSPGRLWLFCLYLQALCAPAICEEWTADVVPEIRALTGSCVVIPCTFTYPGIQRADSQLRGMWFKDKYKHELTRLKHENKFIYYEDQSMIEESFRGRTKLVGSLGKKNCSLEIDDVKDHDTDKYCYRTEIPEHDKYSYNHACVTVNTYKDAPKPRVTHQGDPIEGSPHIVMCTIDHTCPSNIPTLTWGDRTEKPVIEHKDIGQGKWEIMSILTFIPEKKDDHTDLTCTVEYHGKTPVKNSVRLYVKSKENILYIVIPVVAAVGTAVIFGGLCLVMMKKYKKRISELQSRGDNGIWSRLSRMTRRNRPAGHRDELSPSDSRAFWSRFSRRPQGTPSNLGVGYRANNETANISKPRCPSPDRNIKSSYPSKCGSNAGNYADDNVYGNM
ncbi:hypothetical protein AGOR_G00212990 [Albula goreensis]|uniref:Ig-like domain-containing protein n=1 Tax=Albula goreensis TaxID=1534307 RepID=A0A8T3CRA4_9TELE|nr:hypothetical protein AGOR_G00212990 [Albula goreensis]